MWPRSRYCLRGGRSAWNAMALPQRTLQMRLFLRGIGWQIEISAGTGSAGSFAPILIKLAAER
jgi:hypothetical protein